MARVAIQCPPLGVSVFTGILAEWKVQPGDRIEKDQAILVIETDKVTTDVLASAGGVLDTLEVQVGDVVEPEQVLGYIETSGQVSASAAAPAAQPVAATATAAGPATAAPASKPPVTMTITPPAPAAPQPSSNGHAASTNGKTAAGRPHRFSPRVRRLMRENALSDNEMDAIRGSGRNGRIHASDVERYVASGRRAEQSAPATSYVPLPNAPTAAATPTTKRAAPLVMPAPVGEERWTTQRLTTIRKTIATYLRTSVDTAVHTVSIDECDVTELLTLRKPLNEEMEVRYGVKITLTTLIARAVALALREFPLMNSVIDLDNDEVRTAEHIHLGIAVDAPQGLSVPIVRYADTLSLVQLQNEINRVAALVRENKAQLSDLQGSTYTITNAGAEGSIASTPIINYPNVGILGVNKIRRMPVVRDDQIVIRDIMNLSACFDHRLIDGVYNVRFVNRIIALLEGPVRLFI